MATDASLLEFAQFVTNLTEDDLHRGRVSLAWLQARAQTAIDSQPVNPNGKFRQGLPGTFAGERPRFVYMTTPAPGVPAVNDNFLFDAGSTIAANQVVGALNALP
jgi:hypothetical protein